MLKIKVQVLCSIFFVYAMTLISIPALGSAASFDLKMELSIDGQKFSSPRVIVKEGEKAVVTQSHPEGEDATFMEVVATERHINSFETIWLKMVVGRIGKNGEKVVLARPEIATFENEKAEFEVAKDDDEDHLLLSVTAQRKTL